MSAPRTRSRLGTAERRAQLLRIGAEKFGTQAYDDVWMESVAAAAGVSVGLIYHYFGNKKAFAAAVVEAQSEALLAEMRTDASQPLDRQVRDALDAYLRFVEANEHGYRALRNAAAMADEDVRAIVDRNTAELERRIAAALGCSAAVPADVALTVHGWVAFTVAVCLRWLDDRGMDRDAVRDLCARALLRVVAPPEMICPPE
ncbi:TetR/AcrR family transcriptional regulator [Nocardia stercoris]|uniref:TetR/AcrR family transcriptional regulator n=1 Tax=Nocardia stercoris TaxID=2483361 RepID=A0A3M2KTS5_9NOCA|nr:TetR/AcrR family transcriptional regulator [Nocardia stercoris]RMI28344.1 TetR/AcrR family transcriptional regulator [Nocardia stercoris]